MANVVKRPAKVFIEELHCECGKAMSQVKDWLEYREYFCADCDVHASHQEYYPRPVFVTEGGEECHV